MTEDVLSVGHITFVMTDDDNGVVLDSGKVVNSLTAFKEWCWEEYPHICQKHRIKSKLKKDLEIERMIDWPNVVGELIDEGVI